MFRGCSTWVTNFDDFGPLSCSDAESCSTRRSSRALDGFENRFSPEWVRKSWPDRLWRHEVELPIRHIWSELSE